MWARTLRKLSAPLVNSLARYFLYPQMAFTGLEAFLTFWCPILLTAAISLQLSFELSMKHHILSHWSAATFYKSLAKILIEYFLLDLDVILNPCSLPMNKTTEVTSLPFLLHIQNNRVFLKSLVPTFLNNQKFPVFVIGYKCGSRSVKQENETE